MPQNLVFVDCSSFKFKKKEGCNDFKALLSSSQTTWTISLNLWMIVFGFHIVEKETKNLHVRLGYSSEGALNLRYVAVVVKIEQLMISLS